MMRILSCIGPRAHPPVPRGIDPTAVRGRLVQGSGRRVKGGRRRPHGAQRNAGPRIALRPIRATLAGQPTGGELEMDISLRGRAAMITRASKGLGLAMATRFAESGADVALLARRPEVLEEAKAAVAASAKGKVAVFPCDVAKAADIERAYKGVIEVFGKVDILVNNAGESKAMPFTAITDEVWQADFDLKLFAAIRTCRLVLDGMKARRWGGIINVLNIGAKAPRAGGAP